MGKRRYLAMSYVHQRSNGIFEIRYPIPKDVRIYFPKRNGEGVRDQIIESLSTRDRAEASRRATEKIQNLNRRFAALRGDLSDTDFNAFCRSIFDVETKLANERRLEVIELELAEQRKNILDEEYRPNGVKLLNQEIFAHRKSLKDRSKEALEASVGWVVDLYHQSSTEHDSPAPLESDFRIRLLYTAADVMSDVLTRQIYQAHEIHERPTLTAAPLITQPSAEVSVGDNIPLSKEGRLALSKYWDVHEKTKQGSSSPISAHTLKRRKTTWREFQELLGSDTPLFKITKEKVWRYRDALIDAPSYAGSIAALKKLSFPERVAAAKNNPGKYASLDLDSVGDRLRQINAIFQFAVKRGHIDRNPAEGISEGKKGKSDARKAYTGEELQKIFSAEPYFHRRPLLQEQTDEFWVPLLELFTGARASELYVRMVDVFEDHADPHIFITAYDDRPLKTDESERIMPIHPQLVELGFLAYCRHIRSTGSKKLFPSWEYNSETQKQSSGPGRRRFNRFLKTVLPDRGIRADSHTFRHNFETALTNTKGVEERIMLRLAGRTIGGSAATYLTDLGILPALAEGSSRINYSGLSLKHLAAR